MRCEFWPGLALICLIAAAPGATKAATIGYRFVRSVGSQGHGNGQFDQPFGVAVDPTGNIYVADYFNNRIQKFTPEGDYVSQFGTSGSGPGQLDGPIALAVSPMGTIVVVEELNSRAQEFSASGDLIRQIAGPLGSADGRLNHPWGVAIDSAGSVWIADRGNNRLEKYSSTGELITKVGIQGDGNGEFQSIANIAVDANGDVWVVDSFNNMQEFDSAGHFLTKIFLSQPSGITITPSGTIWVSDLDPSDHPQIQGFPGHPPATYAFGAYGSGDGQFNRPLGLASDNKGRIIVADTGNYRFQIWSPIPEPASAVLLAIGIVSVVYASTKRSIITIDY